MGWLVYSVAQRLLIISLTARIKNYPKVHFLIIINPNDGPGNATLMDPNFQRELPRLRSISNIQMVGYVRTGWATRDVNVVLHEVSVYASWADTSANYELDGIFFDETPNHYAVAAATYMVTIDQFAKGHSGFRQVNYVAPPYQSS